MSYGDSPAVAELRAKMEEWSRPGGHGIEDRKHWHKRIRAQRMFEARERGTHTAEEWQAVLDRFDNRCVICGCRPVGRPCKDHIVPIYQGGSDAIDNLQPLCRECNTAKGQDTFDWAVYRECFGFDE